jgi:hypothetical protein
MLILSIGTHSLVPVWCACVCFRMCVCECVSVWFDGAIGRCIIERFVWQRACLQHYNSNGTRWASLMTHDLVMPDCKGVGGRAFSKETAISPCNLNLWYFHKYRSSGFLEFYHMCVFVCVRVCVCVLMALTPSLILVFISVNWYNINVKNTLHHPNMTTTPSPRVSPVCLHDYTQPQTFAEKERRRQWNMQQNIHSTYAHPTLDVRTVCFQEMGHVLHWPARDKHSGLVRCCHFCAAACTLETF